MHRFETFALEQCRDRETRVRGHFRSLQMTPFDRLHISRCSHSIASLALACTFSEM